MQVWGRILWVVVYLFMAQSALAHDAGLAAKLCEAALEPQKSPVGTWDGKTVILDTNVLLNEPHAIYKYPGATVIISGTVHEEMDGKKTDLKVGRAAREFFRTLDGIMKQGGSLKQGVALGNGAILKIDSGNYTRMLTELSYDPAKADNQIIATALHYQSQAGSKDRVILISDDISVRVKAASQELLTAAFDYDFMPSSGEKKENEEATYLKFKVSSQQLNQFRDTGALPRPEGLAIVPNQFVMLEAEGIEGSQATLARYVFDREAASGSLQKLKDVSHLPFQPKNIEQAMLLDVLMDPTIDLVISESPAGTGKTFMALLAGMLQINTDATPYEQLMVTRTLVQIGKENLGAFPGSKEEKLAQWSENYMDSLKAIKQKSAEANAAPAAQSTPVTQILENNYNGHATHKRKPMNRAERRARKQAQQQGQQQRGGGGGISTNKVQLVAFPHLRGRSINDAFLIMDEAQNSSVHEIKTFLTRAGEGSKLVVLGDASQIDLPYLNERNNGLSVTVSLFTADSLTEEQRSRVGYVKLTEGVRSALAELARQLFEKPIPN